MEYNSGKCLFCREFLKDKDNTSYKFCNFRCETNHECNKKGGVTLLKGEYFDEIKNYNTDHKYFSFNIAPDIPKKSTKTSSDRVENAPRPSFTKDPRRLYNRTSNVVEISSS